LEFNIILDQERSMKWGLNTTQSYVFYYLTQATRWAEIHNGFMWVARQKIAEELPILKLKPDSVYRVLKELDRKGVIIYRKDGKKDIIKITKKGMIWGKSTMSDSNPSAMSDAPSDQLGSPVRKRSDAPSDISVHHTISTPNNQKAWDEWIDDLKERNLPHSYTKGAMTKLKWFFDLSHPEQQAIIDQSIQNGWKGLFKIKNNSSEKGSDDLVKECQRLGISSAGLMEHELRAKIRKHGGVA